MERDKNTAEMNKQIKIYGVRGKAEWQTEIQVNGKVRLKLSFTGGSPVGGKSPAKFTTKEPVIQHIIENSELFRSGKIYLVRSIETKEAAVISHGRRAATGAAAGQAASATGRQVAAGDAASHERAEAPDAVADSPVPVRASAAEEAASDVAAEKETVKETVKVEVSDIEGEGRRYLMDNCGLRAHALTSRSKILAAASERGIEFVVRGQ